MSVTLPLEESYGDLDHRLHKSYHLVRIYTLFLVKSLLGSRRLVSPFISFMVILLKGEEKRCSIANRTFCPDTTTVPGDDTLNGGQPNARA